MTTSTTNYRDKAAKTFFFICLFIMGLVIAGNSQNVKITPDGNYVQISAAKSDTAGYKDTGKIFTDSKGVKHTVYVSAKGKLFVKMVSKTSGTPYRKYLKL